MKRRRLLAVMQLAIVGIALLVIVMAPCMAREVGDYPIDGRIAKDRREIDAAFAAELEAIALKCDELEMPGQAAITRNWWITRRYQVQYHFLPDFIARDVLEKKLPAAPKEADGEHAPAWWKRFQGTREKQAERLFALAKKRLTEDRFQESFALLHEVLREAPDHADARRVLGYAGKPGNWTPQERAPRYSKTAQFESTFRWAPNRHGTVESAHFRIKTNADPAAAMEVAHFLEECHDVWRIVFSGYWLKPDELKRYFEGAAPPPPSRNKGKMEVVLFASREEYVSQLEPVEKGIAASRGYYAPGRKLSFFYIDKDDQDVRANWAHEISHQLFSAHSSNWPGLAKKANFWVIEGAAMYMESLAKGDGYVMTGGFDANRLQDARHRQRNLREHASLRELAPLGQAAFQQDPKVRQLYTAAAGYTHFFLDGNDAAYRDGFQRYLATIYEEADSAEPLEKIVAIPPDSVDEQYAEFLDVHDEDLRFLRDGSVHRLVLGRTSVTPVGLQEIRRQKVLRQLDLTELAITDDALGFLAADGEVAELSLFGTPVTSACAKRLATLRGLKELNLSRTKIDDQAIDTLSKTAGLASLFISETAVSDASESSLRKMKQLRELDVTGAKLSPACIERLRNANSELSISP